MTKVEENMNPNKVKIPENYSLANCIINCYIVQQILKMHWNSHLISLWSETLFSLHSTLKHLTLLNPKLNLLHFHIIPFTVFHKQPETPCSNTLLSDKSFLPQHRFFSDLNLYYIDWTCVVFFSNVLTIHGLHSHCSWNWPSSDLTFLPCLLTFIFMFDPYLTSVDRSLPWLYMHTFTTTKKVHHNEWKISCSLLFFRLFSQLWGWG